MKQLYKRLFKIRYLVILLLGILLIFFPMSFSHRLPGHFTPRSNSELQIEFDYPVSWGKIKEVDAYGNTGGMISIKDPSKPWTHCLITRVFSIWLTDLTCHHPEIVLNVVETNPPDDWAIERTNAAMEASINTYGQLLSDEVISIDGQPTRVITLLAAGLLATPGDEQIIIHVYYQTQEIGYYFGLSSLEPVELGGEFHHAFLNILAAIKVIPALQE